VIKRITITDGVGSIELIGSTPTPSGTRAARMAPH
jgi:hypothetical protein